MFVEHVNDVLNESFTKSWKEDILIHLMLKFKSLVQMDVINLGPEIT